MTFDSHDIEIGSDFHGEISSLKHKCGVVGVFNHKDAAALTALGLHALQHRGQEACGIASFDAPEDDAANMNGLFHTERHFGLVGENFAKGSPAIRNLKGFAAIGHNRYSTSGRTVSRNIQPIYADLETGGFAIAHNGNLTNARHLRDMLVRNGAIFQSTMDTEVILHLLARSAKMRVVERFVDAIRQIEGGYALVGLTNKKLIGARDPWGLRPLVLGEIGGALVLASETCALEAMGASFVRDIENGEVIVVSESGVESIRPFRPMKPRPCAFEYLYFARPDSRMYGRNLYEVREELGRQLAREHQLAADIVCPVPDGGSPAALGFSEQSGIPFKFGIVRNQYIGRSFIQPDQSSRQQTVSMKHASNRAILSGKRVVIVDDSIVRGTTSRRIVEMVKAAGASEVHFLVASPPIKYPDYYGIDMPDAKDLIASSHSPQEVAAYLGANSVRYISIEGFYQALGEPPYNPEAPSLADHCFTGNYAAPLVDRDNEEQKKNTEQLTFLRD